MKKTNEDIDLKYLSPVDLTNILFNLGDNYTKLEEELKKLKEKNLDLDSKKTVLKQELSSEQSDYHYEDD